MRLILVYGAAVMALCACSADSSGPVARDDRVATLSDIPTVEIVDFRQGPIVLFADAGEFTDVLFEEEATQLFVRSEADAFTPAEFAFVRDGVFYVLPAEGFQSLSHRLDAELRGHPDSEVYYELRRRGFPYSRHRSYFVE